MKHRKLGTIEVSAVGMGMMGFTHAYGAPPEESESIRLVHEAYELGCNFFDTAEMYSYFGNEEFVGKALAELPRDKIVISDKFWPVKFAGHDFPEPKLSEAGIRKTLEGQLRRLRTDYIDIYTEHQMEDGSECAVAEVMGEFIKEGKIRGWGQSSPTAAQIRAAHAVTPISAIQSEYSMMERKWERDVLPLCRELGIGFVAFSPTGNGFLSGKYRPGATYSGDDVRRVITRFSDVNMTANAPLLETLGSFAAKKGCTMAQLALAWGMRYGDFVVPIPGMRKIERIRENLGAADISLSDAEYAEINAALESIKVYGSRDGKDIKKLGSVPMSVVR